MYNKEYLYNEINNKLYQYLCVLIELSERKSFPGVEEALPVAEVSILFPLPVEGVAAPVVAVGGVRVNV